MSLGVGKYLMVTRRHFLNALAGQPTAKNIFFFVSRELGIAEHTNKGVICPICGKACRNTRLLKSHISRTHGGVVDDLIRKYFINRVK